MIHSFQRHVTNLELLVEETTRAIRGFCIPCREIDSFNANIFMHRLDFLGSFNYNPSSHIHLWRARGVYSTGHYIKSRTGLQSYLCSIPFGSISASVSNNLAFTYRNLWHNSLLNLSLWYSKTLRYHCHPLPSAPEKNPSCYILPTDTAHHQS